MGHLVELLADCRVQVEPVVQQGAGRNKNKFPVLIQETPTPHSLIKNQNLLRGPIGLLFRNIFLLCPDKIIGIEAPVTLKTTQFFKENIVSESVAIPSTVLYN